MSEFNKTQKIIINNDNLDQDKHIFVKLEQEIKQLEILSLKIDQKNIYQSFNSDYGVLIGRVISINNIGVPNARISVFIPIDDEDSLNSDIVSIYPFKTPEDKDINGKKYNLLPRVSEFNQDTGTFKPKQPFGTFPSKSEILANDNLLYVYKKYYKYTALTNEFGDYMIFGCPIGNYTVHMSCDITDIGKYSMIPSSMVTNLGYSPNLFTNNNTKIKESNNLDDLPNIFLQNISVNIIPFWGDSENFDIGFTRLDFKIKCKIEQSFTIFGTSFTHGRLTSIGTPDRSNAPGPYSYDDGFYRYTNYQGNTSDIRVQRTANPIIRLFSFTTDTSIFDITGGTYNLDYDKQIFEVPESAYFKYTDEFGNFILNVPCNRIKQVTDNQGNILNIDDNSNYGSFSKFFGFITVEYPNLSIDATFANKFFDGPSIGHIDRSKLKIPSTRGLLFESDNDDTNKDNNNAWRHEYMMFEGNKFYSISQFLPTKHIGTNYSTPDTVINSTNRFDNKNINDISGLFLRTGGIDEVTMQTDIDGDNYLINPSTGTTYLYDFPYNFYENNGTLTQNKGFGGQFINLAIILPNFTWAFRGDSTRRQNVMDALFDEYKNTFFVTDNTQKLFANITNSKGYLSGFANTTAFIEIPSTEISKIYFNIPNRKGINISLENEAIPNPELRISPDYFKYRAPNFQTDARAYNISAYDINYPYILSGSSNQTAYLFRGMYKGDVIKSLFDNNFL